MRHWAHKGKVTWPRALRIFLEVRLSPEVRETCSRTKFAKVVSLASVFSAWRKLMKAGDVLHQGSCVMSLKGSSVLRGLSLLSTKS